MLESFEAQDFEPNQRKSAKGVSRHQKFLLDIGYLIPEGPDFTVETANGDVQVSKSLPEQICALGENVQPLLVPESPWLLSLGLRCMEYGYEFHWERGKRPYFITPDNRKVELELDGYCPQINETQARQLYMQFDDLIKGTPAKQKAPPENGVLAQSLASKSSVSPPVESFTALSRAC